MQILHSIRTKLQFPSHHWISAFRYSKVHVTLTGNVLYKFRIDYIEISALKQVFVFLFFFFFFFQTSCWLFVFNWVWQTVQVNCSQFCCLIWFWIEIKKNEHRSLLLQSIFKCQSELNSTFGKLFFTYVDEKILICVGIIMCRCG